MQETIDFLLGLNDLHWKGNAYQWFFYAGILLVLVFEKRKLPRIIFGWLPIIYLVALYNPITIKLLNTVGLSNQSYHVRLFSFMPLMYVIARGFTFLLRIRNNWGKLAGVCLVCTLIGLIGKNIYSEPWLTKADNLAKVPQETLDILEAIDAKNNRDVSIAPIGATAIYIRQIDDVVTPYGRNKNEFGKLLSKDPPDARLIMDKAGQWPVDYIMIHKTDTALLAFIKHNFRPYALTDNYALFKVEGVPRLRRTLNEKRQVVSISNYDRNGQLAATDNGYTTILCEYDTDNQISKQSYLDTNGDEFVFPDGYSSVKYRHNSKKELLSIIYLDKDDNLILKDGRYETRYQYDSSGRVIKESYYDETGKPMKRKDGLYAICKFTYLNGCTVERYYDESGKPISSVGGYAGKSRIYDKDGHLAEVVYYDTEDNEIGAIGKKRKPRKECLKYFETTSGAGMDENGTVTFKTGLEGNAINAVWFQLYNAVTEEYLFNFGSAYGIGEISGEYVHKLASGLYKLVFRANTNLRDESITSVEYLIEGETLKYGYHVDEFQDKEVKINNFYIER